MAVTKEDYIRCLAELSCDTTDEEKMERAWRELCRRNELSVEWGLQDLQAAVVKEQFLKMLGELGFAETDVAEIDRVWDDEPRRKRLVRDKARARYLERMRSRDQEKLAQTLLEAPLPFDIEM